MERGKRGIVITNLFPNAVETTRGMFVWQETQRLRDAHGYDLRVLAPLPWVPGFLRDKSRFAHHAAPARETRDGFDVYYPRHVVTPRVLRFCYGHYVYWALKGLFARLHRDAPADFIVAHYAFPDGYAAHRLARRHNLPLLVKVRGSDVNLFTRSFLRRRLTMRTLHGADRVVAVSEALKARMVKLGLPAERIAVMPNGVDRERFAPRDRDACRRALGLPEAPFTFLFVGTLRTIKGVTTLLQAFRAIPEMQRRKASLILIGDGDLEADLRDRIERFGMRDQVRLLPPVPHAEVPQWIGACDCLVLPSIMEGYPNVLVEALAAQRPVIASRVGGIPEIVADGASGLLVPPGEPWPLTDAMIRMLEGFDFDPAASSAAQRSWVDVASEMDGLIQSMLADRGTRP
ncbi:glycosyltransferase family 4 protein [bacterium]|nr:glycosyltransferase family 4 protein [bacterium]